MEYIHFLSTIPTSIDDIPDAEERLRSIQRDLREIGDIIAQQKDTAIKNTILSAILAVMGIIGVCKASENWKDNARIFQASSAIGVIGLLGTIYDGRRVISPGSYDIKTRLGMLQYEQEEILRACSKIRHNSLPS